MKVFISGHQVFKVKAGESIESVRAIVKEHRNFYERYGCKVSILWLGDKREFILMWNNYGI